MAAPTQRTTDLTASGPYDGDLFRYYKVIGRDVYAMVDVHDSHVASLVLANCAPTGYSGSSISPDKAMAIASDYLAAHGVSTDSLAPVVVAKDRGEVKTFQVTWQKTINSAEVPDLRFVELDASTGIVFVMRNASRPYSTPPAASVSANDAVSRAEQAVIGLDGPAVTKPAFSVSETKLQVAFSASGSQQLIWQVMVRRTDLGQRADAFVVTVDAMTGKTVVMQ
jgi:hypothetical protein